MGLLEARNYHLYPGGVSSSAQRGPTSLYTKANMTSPSSTGTSGYSIQIWGTADEIDTAAWEELRDPDDLFMDLRMLRVTARTMSDTDEFGFVLVRDSDGRPVAATCLWKFTIEGTLLARDNWSMRLLKRLAKILPTINHHRILVCGMPVSAGQSNLRFAPGADHETILAVLNDRLEAIARSERLRCIVFKEFEDHEVPFASSLERLGYVRSDSLPMNQFNPSCRSFEEYLASLKSRKRWQIKDSLRKLEGGNLRLHVTSDPKEIALLYTDSVHQLYEAVLGRAEARLESLSPDFFREIPRQFPDNSVFCFLRDGDVVCAFGVVLFSQSVAYALYVGVDYEKNAEHHLYFNTMYAMLAESLRRDVKLVSWGQTADQFKQSKLNCHQTSRCFFLKGTNFLMKTALAALRQQLFPEHAVCKQPPAEQGRAQKRVA